MASSSKDSSFSSVTPFSWHLCTRGTRPASKDLGLTQRQTSKCNSMRTTLTDARSSVCKRPVGLNGQVLAHNLWQSIFCFTFQASPHPLTVWCPIQHGWRNASRRRCLWTCLLRGVRRGVGLLLHGAWQVNLQVRVREALKPRRSCSIPGARGKGCRQRYEQICDMQHKRANLHRLPAIWALVFWDGIGNFPTSDFLLTARDFLPAAWGAQGCKPERQLEAACEPVGSVNDNRRESDSTSFVQRSLDKWGASALLSIPALRDHPRTHGRMEPTCTGHMIDNLLRQWQQRTYNPASSHSARCATEPGLRARRRAASPWHGATIGRLRDHPRTHGYGPCHSGASAKHRPHDWQPHRPHDWQPAPTVTTADVQPRFVSHSAQRDRSGSARTTIRLRDQPRTHGRMGHATARHPLSTGHIEYPSAPRTSPHPWT